MTWLFRLQAEKPCSDTQCQGKLRARPFWGQGQNHTRFQGQRAGRSRPRTVTHPRSTGRLAGSV